MSNSGPAKERSERAILQIGGMHCASCVSSVERALRNVPGVQAARVNLPLSQAAVDYEPALATIEKMAQAVAASGYQARPSQATGKSAGAVLEERSAGEIALWRNR